MDGGVELPICGGDAPMMPHASPDLVHDPEDPISGLVFMDLYILSEENGDSFQLAIFLSMLEIQLDEIYH